ncbi:unnamed protein product [Auanema sp. JU1783]|nr:unnamed protein product [Auanema sp. JU1783]
MGRLGFNLNIKSKDTKVHCIALDEGHRMCLNYCRPTDIHFINDVKAIRTITNYANDAKIYTSSWYLQRYVEPHWKILERDRLPPYDVFVISSYYYNTSKSLGDHSIALVLTGPHDYADNLRQISILSWNGTDSLYSTVDIESITPHKVCLWISMLVTAPVLPNLKHLAIIQGERTSQIPFTTPNYMRREVVTCIAPLFANEQWQFFLFAVHTYRRYGSFMHLYVRSMVEPVYRLVLEYEKLGYLQLQPWLKVHLSRIDPSHNLFNPNVNIEFRNQAAAQTDCLLQYKESAQFIAFMDLDDVLIPRIGSTYLEEFNKLFNQSPHIGYIFYDKQNVNVRIQRSPEKFSLKQMFTSISFTDVSETGKMITRPEFINSTWIHWPAKVAEDRIRYNVPPEMNVITHLKHFHYESQPTIEDIEAPRYNITPKNTNENLLSRSAIAGMQEELEIMFTLPAIKRILKRLPMKWFYFDIILECYTRIFYRFHYSGNHAAMKCPGPDRCSLPKHSNISCANAHASYYSASRPGTLVNFHYWKDARFMVEEDCVS